MELLKRIAKILKAELDSSENKVVFDINPERLKVTEFDFKPQATNAEEVLDLWVSFLWKICRTFEIDEVNNIELTFEEGQDVYNRISHDFRVKLYTANGLFIHRIQGFPQLSSKNLMNNYTDCFADLATAFSRYFLETNSVHRIIVKKHQDYSYSNRIFTVVFCSIEEHLAHDSFNSETPIQARFKKSEILEQLNIYAESGIFTLLPNETIDKGIYLCLEYNFYSKQDILWCFNNLIHPCCPMETSSYQRELKELMAITNGKLKITEYTEHEGDEEDEDEDDDNVSIDVTINDKPFSVRDLPFDFSLHFIIKLNKFLSENFNSSFYLWEWERNPWEQVCFIYLENQNYTKHNNMKNEFTLLDSTIADLYDEYR